MTRIPEETLDPQDWEAMRRLAHRMIDDAVDYTAGVRERPVWQEMPDAVRAVYRDALPRAGRPLDEVYEDLSRHLMPYPMGNVHPRFWMWFMGSSNFTGALGDFLAAVQGSNLGAGAHSAAQMDRQVVDWMKQIVGFPDVASGTLVSGGSVANLIGLTVARNAMVGHDVRENGLGGARLRYYASDQVHACHQTALETLGLGNAALRRIPSRADCSMDVEALRRAIAEDRAAGVAPACVIATAGTVNTGAIDDLGAIADLCAAEGLWFHVDGCIGALVALAPENGHKVAGLDCADSLALDPHKWLHAPFEVGCCLVRDADRHLRTFSLSSEYLETTKRGIAAAPFLHDFGLQTSRGFRALKVWMSLQEQGADKFGRLIDQNIAQAHDLARRLEALENVEMIAPVSLNIVCFRLDPGDRDEAALHALNTEVMLRLQEDGLAAISDTTVKGRHCLRAAIVNHRTRSEDIDIFIDDLQRIAASVAAKGPVTEAASMA